MLCGTAGSHALPGRGGSSSIRVALGREAAGAEARLLGGAYAALEAALFQVTPASQFGSGAEAGMATPLFGHIPGQFPLWAAFSGL
jgi:hypothetical protein